MKKSILLFVFLFSTKTIFAQAPVTDAAANAQLANLNAQLATLNSIIGQLNTTSVSNRIENETAKLINKDQFNLQDIAEKALWKVPQILKQGKEINSILDREARIIQSIQKLNNILNSSNFPSEMRSILMNKAYSLLTTTGGMVDAGLGILTDNSVRMEQGERRNYLKDIDSGLSSIEGLINGLLSSANSYKGNVETQNSYKNNADKALQKLKSY